MTEAYIVIVLLSSSTAILSLALYKTRGTDEKYRRALSELRATDKFIASACKERDDTRREMERYKDLNARYLREMNARKVA